MKTYDIIIPVIYRRGVRMVVLYMTLFLIISVATFLQFFSNKVATFWFLIFGIVLTLLSMFRFGSGTDYFGYMICLLYTSDAADEEDSVDLGGRRIIKKKKKKYY